MKTKYNIGDLVWVFHQHWPKEREMGIIIDTRPVKEPMMGRYQVKLLHKPLYMLWYCERHMEKMKAQPKE